MLLNTALAAVVGLLAAGGISFLLENLDDTVKRGKDLANIGLSPLAAVTRFRASRGRKGSPTTALVAAQTEHSRVVEDYRFLRTNIQFASMDQEAKILLVTSGEPYEGKSTISANLAVVMAQAGLRTLLIDVDLRSPTIYSYFGLANNRGLTSLLLDEEQEVEGQLLRTEVKNLAVIPSGPVPENPTELLASSRMADLLEQTRELADIVILDSPPLHAMADASILAGQADATLLVIEAGKTRFQAVLRSVEGLNRCNARTLGAVLNKSSEPSSSYYRYYTNTNKGSRARICNKRSWLWKIEST